MRRLNRLPPLVLILCLFLGSCASVYPDPLAYQTLDFSAELRGTLYGNDFCAKIEVRNRPAQTTSASHDPTPTAPHIIISYLEPEALRSISVSVFRDVSTGDEWVTASYGELSANLPREAAKGWLLPVDSLLSLSKNQSKSIQKNEGGYLLTFPDEITLEVSERGEPKSLRSESVSFEVRWFERH